MEALLSAETIAARVRELGAQIARDYAGKDLVLVTVLKGAFVFGADLSRAIDLPLTVEFFSASSYGDGVASTGDVRVTLEPEGTLAGRDVLLVEDIVDTGRTAARLLELLRGHEPASLKLCALLDKPSRREVEVTLDYKGFEIADEFVVGYGLDLAGVWRNLPYVGVINTD
ncbi:MAG TPA: hypoxanthine phosphoribosyltransferase [Fibrobacteria bacterium]|jgi:hypoxanthine phosphoribosyltransferase|nr:hypoxanthine phosphoribosyltransferase [Fibrobacteria bacterium]